MVEPSNDLSLAREFPAATREQWLALVQGVLKGAPFDTLVARTYDDLPIAPLSPRVADAMPIGRHGSGPWQVLQRVDHSDAAAANAEALHDLENGATGLCLVFAGAAGAHGYGIDPTEAALERALDGIHLDADIAIELELSLSAMDVPRQLSAMIRRRGVAPAATDIRFAVAPLGAMLATGIVPAPWDEVAANFAHLLKELAGQGFRGPFAVADGRIIHDAGGSEAQELGTMIAVALTYLRLLEAHGVSLDAARRMTIFRLSADADQFLTIAKLRALRKLWARIEEASGLNPEPIFISAQTSWRMMSRRDPHGNMLRAAIAVAAAGLGGADAITVLPFSLAHGLPDRFARRIARNTQLVLLEESHLARVADPAAGAGGIEQITDKLCEAGWAHFQEIERAGGAWPAFQQGLVQRKIAVVRAARETALRDGRMQIVGTTTFPNPDTTPPAVLDVPPRPAPALPAGIDRIEALRPVRVAEPFE